MEPFLYYLLRSSICLLLFYGFFQLAVKRSTFHHVNRVTILSLVAASLILPLFQFNELFAWHHPERTVTVNYLIHYTTTKAPVEPVSVFPWMQMICLLYLSGVLVVLAYYLMAWMQVRSIIRTCTIQPDSNADAPLYVSDKEIAPFTWMNKIVISKADLMRNGDIILRHERAHVRLCHSLDLLFMAVVSLLFWFNPFTWLFKHSLQQVHEFEADQQVLNDGIDAKQYKLVLIRRSAGEKTFAMANNFTYCSLQKRIQMMTKKKSDSLSRLSYWGVIPVVLLAVMMLSVPVVNAQKKEPIAKPAPASSKVTTNVQVIRTDSTTITKVQSDPVKGKKGETIAIVSKQTSNPEQINVNVNDKVRSTVVIRTDSASTTKPPLFIVDGVKQASVAGLDPGWFLRKESVSADGVKHVTVEGFDPETIESVNVLKNKAATDLYGEEGKNGVVIITLKKDKK